MKCSNCKCKVTKDKLIVSWIKYFCSNQCRSEYMDNNIQQPIKIVWKKTKERLASEWSESVLFMKRFNELKREWRNYCMVTGKLLTIDMLSPASFPHWYPKWKYPELRYFKNNIFLVDWIDNHSKFDSYFKMYKDFIWDDILRNKILSWEDIFDDLKIFIINKILWI